MGQDDVAALARVDGVAPWRLGLARWVESDAVQRVVIGVILVNGLLLGLETDGNLMASHGSVLVTLDRACLVFFAVELLLKLVAYRWRFWRSGWNVFDAVVVLIAVVPGAGPWAVLRTMRVLRVLRLLTAVPSLRRVVAAFLHAIPGLLGVIAVMVIFMYTVAVLVTKLFGSTHPEWFGSLGRSLYTLFQVMTLESWSMGIVRPLMEEHPMAWAIFVPFIVVATFTILNLFIGIIVSTMQELALVASSGKGETSSSSNPGQSLGAAAPATSPSQGASVSPEVRALLTRLDADLRRLGEELQARAGAGDRAGS